MAVFHSYVELPEGMWTLGKPFNLAVDQVWITKYPDEWHVVVPGSVFTSFLQVLLLATQYSMDWFTVIENLQEIMVFPVSYGGFLQILP